MSVVELRKWGISPQDAKNLSGDDIKAIRLGKLQEESANWPPAKALGATTVDEARQDIATALAMIHSPEWKAFRPDLPGGPDDGGKKGKRSM
mmetsp:Transcript_37328/g.116224  ORF Transcript_37328/g.116224 Transcript_37328/m.116224 type:complete len:92 (+) Transcript_37328:84-359(+)